MSCQHSPFCHTIPAISTAHIIIIIRNNKLIIIIIIHMAEVRKYRYDPLSSLPSPNGHSSLLFNFFNTFRNLVVRV